MANTDIIFTEDVLELFGNKTSKSAIYSLIREKKIKATKVGKRYLFSKRAIEEFISKELGYKPLS